MNYQYCTLSLLQRLLGFQYGVIQDKCRPLHGAHVGPGHGPAVEADVGERLPRPEGQVVDVRPLTGRLRELVLRQKLPSVLGDKGDGVQDELVLPRLVVPEQVDLDDAGTDDAESGIGLFQNLFEFLHAADAEELPGVRVPARVHGPRLDAEEVAQEGDDEAVMEVQVGCAVADDKRQSRARRRQRIIQY